jgi:prephenate dehydrogenase
MRNLRIQAVDSYFHRISIVGLGLIGGSWGHALRGHGFRGVRIGSDRPETLKRALAAGAIDEAREDVADAVSDADLVILAAGVGGILDLLPCLSRAVSHHALVTDVGSTKRLICLRARQVFGKEPMFLGGHPLAGKERSGIENAEGSLFEKAFYALTPLSPDHLSDERIQAFFDLVKSTGARPFVTDPAAHDHAVAYLSHLPQLLSSGLASLIAEQSAEEFFPLELAGSGFRDLTRLAESPYALWRDICLTNVENIQAALESLIQKLESMKVHLSNRELEREFKQALKLRERLRSAQGSD